MESRSQIRTVRTTWGWNSGYSRFHGEPCAKEDGTAQGYAVSPALFDRSYGCLRTPFRRGANSRNPAEAALYWFLRYAPLSQRSGRFSSNKLPERFWHQPSSIAHIGGENQDVVPFSKKGLHAAIPCSTSLFGPHEPRLIAKFHPIASAIQLLLKPRQIAGFRCAREYDRHEMKLTHR